MRVGIVGCGLIGGKRADALKGTGDTLVATFDLVTERARALAGKHGAEVAATLDELVAKVDVVVVAATNDQLTPLSMVAARAGKHVVVEKPAARSAKELEPLAAMARDEGVVVKVGYNHRFHPAAQKARAILDAGDCGDVMFLRGRYGHGGRIGYDKEWRADPEKSGGGELIDQGVHLIDLARWFLGAELTDVQGRVETYFWKMPVDDNAFMTLGTAAHQVAHLQVSCTEWKNMFSLEIYARHAKLHWEGLGGSYGPERLYHYAMKPEMGPPDAVIYEYAPADRSWALEWQDFARAVRDKTRPCGDVEDALQALRVVDRLYGR
ncbi:MAG TPA: Gfo/Idh/MocA family oxidoreductase [Polyangiaceae bacterium]|jgi:predicted dehydrogenase